MKIAIAGSNGFLGSNLFNFLKGDFSIASINRTDDLRFAINQSTVIVNLAGKAHDLKNVADLSSYYELNEKYSNRLYDFFLLSDAKVFITISSVKAAADSVAGVLMEEMEPFPTTHYGKSKRLAEYHILSKGIPTGKRVYILRPCMIHGPGNKGNLNLLYKLAQWGFPWPLAAFENKRSFCSVENICFVIRELITRDDIPSGIYNVADDEPLSTNQLIQIFGDTLGKKTRFWKIPKSIIRCMAKIGDKIYLPLNSERLAKLTENYVVSNQKLRNALGKEFPVKAIDGLKSTILSFQTEKPK